MNRGERLVAGCDGHVIDGKIEGVEVHRNWGTSASLPQSRHAPLTGPRRTATV
jgi:hypothetical protein